MPAVTCASSCAASRANVAVASISAAGRPPDASHHRLEAAPSQVQCAFGRGKRARRARSPFSATVPAALKSGAQGFRESWRHIAHGDFDAERRGDAPGQRDCRAANAKPQIVDR